MQPVNSYEDTFKESIKLARGENVFCIRVAKAAEVMRQRTGLRTVDWCEEIGFLGEDVWFAHCWELDGREISKLASTNTGVSHCPEPVYLVGEHVTPLSEMASKGVRLGLGADGPFQ